MLRRNFSSTLVRFWKAERYRGSLYFLMKLLLIFCSLAAVAVIPLTAKTPNIVVIFCDDLGYSDVGCFGAKGYETPHLDKMAKEGIKFTNFHVASAVCSASRAALLTGCYNTRVGINGALGPNSKIGLSLDELTMGELVQQNGYATACFGKWHLGDHPRFLPTNNGFDEYYGLPYSNDMWPYHPGVRHLPMEKRIKRWPHLPLIEGTKVINPKVSPKDQEQLTTDYTKKAVKFIEKNTSKPFFLYLAHSMPHVPLYVSDKFRGKTKRGIYGDVIAEIDWSVGQVLDVLKHTELDRNTLVIFTSDNGPWLSYGEHSGLADPLREGKGTSWEGGVRVPFIARWPGRIPEGSVNDNPAMTIDLYPTIAGLTKSSLPEHEIDGKDIWPMLSGKKDAKSPQEAYYIYYSKSQLQAVISGAWKLILPHKYRTMGGKPGGKDGIPNGYSANTIKEPELYHLKSDVSEKKNLAEEKPEELKRLLALAERAYKDLGDGSLKRKGSGRRPVGRVPK